MIQSQTRAALLKEAETLIRTQGYAAFSYADLAERVGIRKASIHHHFPTKEALGTSLIDEYLKGFVAELDALEARRLDTRSKLLTYGGFFADGLRDGLMPLCGALAADAAYLPKSMQQRVEHFFSLHLRWLERVIRAGVAAGDLSSDLKPERAAVLVLSTLQGASLVAWALKNATVIKPALKDLVDQLTD